MSFFPLENGVAVVTGAASGIGAALATTLARHRCHLALIDRDAGKLAEIAAAARAFGVTVSEHVADLGDADAISALPEQVLAAHGRVTILVNNAGVALVGGFMEATLDDFAWLMDINFWAPVRLTRHFMFALTREPQAHIVNISSVFGLAAPPGQTAYCAAKFGVRGFSESLRHELEGGPVTLTVVHPGGIATQIARNARVAQGIDPAVARKRTESFSKALRTPPQTAADAIVAAIRKRQPRLLIGGDARFIDIVQRLFPATYWRRLRVFFGAAAPKEGS